MSKFQEDDNLGREILSEVANDFLLFFSSEPMTKHDGFLFSGITSVEQKDEKPFQRFVFDVKKRNRSYSTMLIEKDKYDHLNYISTLHQDKNLIPLYINILEEDDNKIIAWDLNQFKNLQWQEEKLPQYTSKKSNDKVKLVAYLPLKNSFEIK